MRVPYLTVREWKTRTRRKSKTSRIHCADVKGILIEHFVLSGGLISFFVAEYLFLAANAIMHVFSIKENFKM